jgi:ectoine hydroxylase-related dioxygenase (phytanoyl-CoA dioxygenase family)
MTSPDWDACRETGAVVVRSAFDPGWIDVLRHVADGILGSAVNQTERLSGAATSRSRSVDGIWRESEPFARFLATSPIVDLAAAAMDSASVHLYEDLFLYNEPAEEGAPWHRDAPHWPLSGQQLTSVWLSLEPVEIDSGALHFIAGSHRDSDDVVRSEPMTMTLDDARQPHDVFGFTTEPGDAVVFHPRLLHAALGAARNRPRRTFTIRFMGDDIRWRPRSSYYHPWMRDLELSRGDHLDHLWFPTLRETPGGVGAA